ncbi:MAG: hypothetical protein IKC63_07335, partial [Clostridia bacterium]|nr:hypothetical protein [Clostridia bacterium]
ATHNDLFLVKGTLTVNGGTITLTHAAANMAWNGATSVFDVTDGGVLNLNGVTAENLGGTDMNFVVHLNNWGEVTLNVQDSTLKATYCAVRVFNSGFDMNNVTIKNSTIYSKGNRAFWVHNYLGDLDSSKHSDDAIKARLNFDIFGNGNTYVAETNTNGGIIRYGFGTTVYYNADGALIVSDIDNLKGAIEDGGDIALGGTVDLGGAKDAYLSLSKDTTVTGGTIKGTGWTGELNYAVNASSGNIVFDGVTFDTTDWTTVGWANWGISVNVNGTANVTFKNCTFKGNQCPIYQSGAGSVITLENCKFEPSVGAIQCEIYSGDFSLGQDLIVKNCDFTGVTDVLHIYDYDKNPSTDAIVQYLTDNGNIFTGTCKQTCQ